MSSVHGTNRFRFMKPWLSSMQSRITTSPFNPSVLAIVHAYGFGSVAVVSQKATISRPPKKTLTWRSS
jgi:hypothetical protein